MEVVGIGSIPIFISAIIDNNYLHSKLDNIDYFNDIDFFESDNLATIFLFFVLAIFLSNLFIKFSFLIMKQNF